MSLYSVFFFFSSRRRHTRLQGDWSSDVCSSDLVLHVLPACLVYARQTLRWRAGTKGRLRYIEFPSADDETTEIVTLRASSSGRQEHTEHCCEGEPMTLHAQLLLRINAC